MKNLILAVLLTIAGWSISQAQSKPAPEKYNSFIEQIAQQAPQSAEMLMAATMESLSKDPMGYRQMLELAERRFSDPADPIHNEALYMVVLKHAAENYVLSATEKEKQRLLLEGAKKNMIGTVATDFDYIMPNDKNVHHLKDLKADNILVYFNNPDCESCEKVKERLSTSELINQLVNDKKLIVLAIYPYDDEKLWKKAKYPGMMINGWNQSRNIEYNELYDLPTLPCFYLLDKDYTVLLKNEGSLNKVEAKLKALTAPEPEAPAPEAPNRLPVAQPAKPSAPVAASPDDPNVESSEKMINYIIEDNSPEIYNLMADQVKQKFQPDSFTGTIGMMESQMGKYISHGSWMNQVISGRKAYLTLMDFEKGDVGMMILFDNDGKVLGITPVNPQILKGEE
ncbi:MAG: DUF5106 domain-containing protein [Muribaculaceae bacterium]|nr:DUF5106 domain-containing protein [Muribaculaceae bacterium]MBQ7205732.1 DUF5106 domain-containing protein [Muribaculaceae bacterium]